MVQESSTGAIESRGLEEVSKCRKEKATELMVMHKQVEVQAERRVKVVSCCLHPNGTPEKDVSVQVVIRRIFEFGRAF